MLFFAISGFLNFIFGSIFLVFILAKYRRDRMYYVFSLSNISFLVWSIFYGFWQLAQDAESALFWCRMFSLGSTLIPPLFFHLTAIILDVEKKQRKVLIFAYVQTIIYLAFNFSPLFIKSVEPVFGFPFWPKPGIIYSFYVVFSFFGLLLYSTYLLFQNYREAVGLRKERIKYASVAYLLPILGGATNFPYWYGIKIPPYGSFFTFLYPVIMGYVISRYRLMDIKIVIGNAFSYIFSFVSVIASSVILFFVFKSFESYISINLIYIFVLIIGIILYQFFAFFYKTIINKIFFKKIYSYQLLINDISKELVSILDFHKIIYLITDSLFKALNIEQIAVVLKDNKSNNYKVEKNIGFRDDLLGLLIKENLFLGYLQKEIKPLVYEEIISQINVKKNKAGGNFIKNINKTGIDLCLPLLRKNELIGIIILGRKISGDSYSTQDISLLTTLSNQVSIAIENARLYDQVQDLSQNLQKKVEDQTKELKDAYQMEKKAREELERLDTTKNQFLLATQHHLRTPLTAMRWNADLLLKTKLSKKAKLGVESIKLSTGKLIKMVNEFLDITQFQLGKNIAYVKLEINLQEILKEIISELEYEKTQRKIFIKLENPENMDFVLADREKLKAALFNIIDNAVKYTTEGGVTITVEKQDKNVILKVKDTGIGISAEHIKDMFNKVFERGQEAQKTFVTGRGIGLYIASQIIKAHNGKIWVKSEGEGKGSTFYIEFPIK